MRGHKIATELVSENSGAELSPNRNLNRYYCYQYSKGFSPHDEN